MSRRCPVCGTEYPDEIAFCGHDGSVTIQVQPPGAEPDPRLGTKLGDYTVVAHVADGAMGAVYEARHADTRERVAIKVLHEDVAEDEIAVERFNREYETASMFDHPHIVRVVDFGDTGDGSSFLTMEYLTGLELGQLMRSTGALPVPRTLRFLAQVAGALEHAHSFGVIHRDLKPDNIFLCEAPDGDDVRILDFGSVKLQVEMGPKLTAFGTTLGSPYYMSPEQAKGLADVDSRTDVFAIGAILYEALTGKIAFEASTVAEILMKIVRSMPEPLSSHRPDLPPALDGIIEKALAKDKAQRFETPLALVDAVFRAFGVAGSAADWAERPLAELEAAIGGGAPVEGGAAAQVGSAAGPAAPMAEAAPGPTAPGPAAPASTDPGQAAAPRPAGSLAPMALPTKRSTAPLVLVGAAVLAFGVVVSCLLFAYLT